MGDINKYLQVGWKEWGSLPDLDIERVHIKIDTGAKTSSLHCVKYEKFERKGKTWVRFWTAVDQDSETLQVCEARLLDKRSVTSSGGHSTHRPVIQSELVLGDNSWPIEITLADRSVMRFRMLLGREAMVHMAVYPHEAHIQGQII
ncbi:ATP-dependent zinc protease family protein [Marinicella rhabdoformis]|uniref:ATP-dependent zinc protease family protein n=1 Tax=Marinicella rhabdoformis TaxID=2580566 RepID=UPI0012AECB08|nr:ATP-dependent zinc protease [Marinicella rhabdoformis]